MAQLVTRLSAGEVRRLLSDLVAGLSGPSHDPAVGQAVRGVRLRAGMVALSLIQQAFLEKARGGVGEDGIKWAPLSPKTIAYGRRVGPGDAHLLRGIHDKGGPRPYLTGPQDKRWRMIYATRRSWLMAAHGMDERSASARAAQIAWATLKAEGAKTKLQVLGGRTVEIGRDTGRLFASLSPGTPDPGRHPLGREPPPEPAPAAAGDRVLREEPGAVIVGTNVEYAGDFHRRRPLWPPDGQIPAAWAAEVAAATRDGIAEAVVLLLTR